MALSGALPPLFASGLATSRFILYVGLKVLWKKSKYINNILVNVLIYLIHLDP